MQMHMLLSNLHQQNYNLISLIQQVWQEWTYSGSRGGRCLPSCLSIPTSPRAIVHFLKLHYGKIMKNVTRLLKNQTNKTMKRVTINYFLNPLVRVCVSCWIVLSETFKRPSWPGFP